MAATMTGRRNNQMQQDGVGMSRWLCVLAVLLLTIGLCGFAIPNPQQQYLVDQTGVMGTDVEKALQSWNQAFAKSGAQIAMAVIPTLDGEDLETTATDTFRSWGVGHSQENNGVLILIVLNERRIRVEVGYGLEEVLPDGLVGRLMREYAYPAFAQNRYAEGSVALIDAIGQKIAEKYQIQTERGRLPLTVSEKPFRIGPFFKLLPLLLILFVVLRRNRRIRGRGRRRSESSGMGWLVIFEILEALFRNGGGGGRGGFGGGGFGGFGGGSSGGGGASGKW